MDTATRVDEDKIVEAKTVDHVGVTTGIVTAYLSRNHVPVTEIRSLLVSVHSVVASLDQGAEANAPTPEKLTASQIRRSIKPDALISFIDGKPYKTLKRHLTKHGLTMEQYRDRFGLPWDYPSTAANYSAARAVLAKQMGLGRKVRS